MAKKTVKPEWKNFKWHPIGGSLHPKTHSSLCYYTGFWKTFRPVVDFKKCINCLMCVAYCPENTIKAKNDKLSNIDLTFCKGCSLCAKICPVNAIVMKIESGFHK